MPPAAEQVQAHFDRPHLYLRNRVDIELRADIVGDLAGRVEGAEVLDIGCGDGSLSRQFLSGGNRLTLIDLAPGMLDVCRRNLDEAPGRLELVQADFLRHDFGRTFDLVLCVGVLAHVESVERAVTRLAALCRAGGRCIVEFTDASRIVARIAHRQARLLARLGRGLGYVTNRVTATEFFALAARHGLAPLAHRRYSLLLPGMRRLPVPWLRRYHRATLERPLLSRMGSEVIAALEKRTGGVASSALQGGWPNPNDEIRMTKE